MSAIYFDPGELRAELSLQECQTAFDELGGHFENWVDTATVFAKIEPVKTISVFGADQTRESVTHRIILRWQAGVASGMRFAKQDRLFEILTVHDPDESGRYLVCNVEEKGA